MCTFDEKIEITTSCTSLNIIHQYLDHMIHLHDHEYLFKRSLSNYDIKTILFDMIYDDIKNKNITSKVFNIENYDDIKDCIVCTHAMWYNLQYGDYIYHCNYCAHEKVKKMCTSYTAVPVKSGKDSYYIFYKHINYWIIVSNDTFCEHSTCISSIKNTCEHSTCISSIKNNELQNLFINIPHKLTCTFYHITSIIFLLSMCDNTSSLYMLNIDIIKHILYFIY